MKFLFKLFLFLALLLVAAVIALPFVIDPNDYKDRIAQQVEQQTGRKLVLTGSIKFSLFPLLGLELEQAWLGNAAGFGDKPFAQVDKAGVSIKLLPLLLHRRLEASTLVLQGLRLHLIRAQDGSDNWQGLAGKGETSGGDREPPPLAALLVGGIDIRDGLFILEDRQAKRGIQLTEMQLRTGQLQPGQPVEFESSAKLQPLPKGPSFQARIAGRLTYDPTTRMLELGDLKAQGAEVAGPQSLALEGQLQADLGRDLVNVKGLSLTGRLLDPRTNKPVDLSLTAQLAYNGGNKRLSLAPLKLRLSEVDGPQTVSIEASVEGDAAQGLVNARDLRLNGRLQPPNGNQLADIALTGQLALNLFKMHGSMAPMQLSLGYPGLKHPLKLSGNLNADLGKDAAALDGLQASFGALALSGQLQVRNLRSQRGLSGQLALAPFNARQALADLGLPGPNTADPSALSRAALSLGLNGSLEGLDLNDIKLTLDDTQVSGKGRLALGAKPAVNFNLTINQIDLNRYLAPPSAAPGADATPLAALFAAELHGDLGIDNLKLHKLQAAKLKLRIDQAGGKLTLGQQIGAFYQGTYKGSAQINAGKTPTLNYKASLSGVQAEPLLKALTGEARLSGKGNVDLELNSQGATTEAMLNGMNGDLQFRFRDGAIKGFNLAQIIRDAKARIAEYQGERQAPSASATTASTDFSQLDAKARIKGRIIDNTALNLMAPYFRFDGKGVLDTARQTLDYELTTVVVNSELGQGGKDLRELENIPIPMSYRGPVAEAGDWRQWKIRLDQVLRAKAEQKLEDEARKLLQQKLGPPKDGADGQQPQERSLEQEAIDRIKRGLKDIF